MAERCRLAEASCGMNRRPAKAVRDRRGLPPVSGAETEAVAQDVVRRHSVGCLRQISMVQWRFSTTAIGGF